MIRRKGGSIVQELSKPVRAMSSSRAGGNDRSAHPSICPAQDRDVRHMTDARPVRRHPPATSNRRAFLARAAGVGLAAAALPLTAAGRTASGDSKPFLIALEEHFATPELRRLQGAGEQRLFSGGRRRPELFDLAAGRIADMDAAGIGMQVLSAVTPGAQNLAGAEGVAFARTLNAWVADEVVAARPDRFPRLRDAPAQAARRRSRRT